MTVVTVPDHAGSIPATSGAPRAGLSLTAAAACPERGPGDALTADEMVKAFDRARWFAGRGSGTDGDRQRVATITADVPEGRHLKRFESEVITRDKLDAVTERRALTAAGVCAPYVIDYSMGAIGSVDRPVRDIFPQFVADRGGIQFRRDVDSLGGGPVSASGTWTMATDAYPNGAVKNVWEIPCTSVVTAEVQAVTFGARFSNITSRFDPEATAANLQAGHIAWARFAERNLLNSLYSQCTATFTQGQALGTTRDILVALDKSLAYMRTNRRQGGEITFRTILPRWILDEMRADLTRAMHTGNEKWLGEADDTILSWFANRGVTVSWTLDGRDAISAAGSGNTATPKLDAQTYTPLAGSNPVPPFPATIEFPLFPEGCFVFMDGGTLDVGTVRDQSLVQQNKYVTFEESWEGLYRKGVEAVRIVAQVLPTGASSGTVSPSTLAA